VVQVHDPTYTQDSKNSGSFATVGEVFTRQLSHGRKQTREEPFHRPWKEAFSCSSCPEEPHAYAVNISSLC
jgi:hypothetical protein